MPKYFAPKEKKNLQIARFSVKFNAVCMRKQTAGNFHSRIFICRLADNLNGNNRWGTLADEIDWDFIEENYSPLLSQSGMGQKP